MDSLDLLAREDEFKKLNKQLEKKTESLMKEIEHAMVGFHQYLFHFYIIDYCILCTSTSLSVIESKLLSQLG